ncbi:MAG: NUDIX domain-containing protein, partial [Varibaculum cambriense]|nr:NUDIX domain-containing protein [Varibaculum cambriense]
MRTQLRDAEKVAVYRHEALSVVLQIRGDSPQLMVLVAQRDHSPFQGLPALPSGPLEPAENLGASAFRHLSEKMDIAALSYMEQLGTRSDPSRDPSQRTVATAYLGLVPSQVKTTIPTYAQWMPVNHLPQMAYDHANIISEGVDRLRAKLSYTNIAFALAPPDFTMAELTHLYQAALGHEVSPTNLQRVLTRRGQLAPTGQPKAPGTKGGR